MTFGFDGGDILVLLLAGIALLVFRRFDKANRSLEKVKILADQQRSVISDFITEREVHLKDLIRDIDIKEKTNRQILARAEDVRAEIIKLTEGLEEQMTRIKDQDSALKGLDDFAGRVDENLKRLKEESQYIDKVGSRLREVRNKLSEFEERDKTQFEELRRSVHEEFNTDLINIQSSIGETDRQVALYKDTMENLNVKQDEVVRDKLSKFRDELELIEEKFQQRLEEAAEEGERLENDAFLVLKEKIESRTTRLEGDWLGELNTLKDEVSASVSGMQNELQDTRHEMDELGEQVQNAMDGITADLSGIKERVLQSSQELDGQIKEHLHSASARITTEVTELDSRVQTDLSVIKERVLQSSQEIDGQIKEHLHSASARITTEVTELDSRVQTDLSAIKERVLQSSQELDGQIKEHLHSASARITTEVTELDSRVQTDLSAMKERVFQNSQELDGQIKDHLHSTSARITTEVTELDSRVHSNIDRIENTLAQCGGQVQSMSERLKADLKEQERLHQSRVEKLNNSMAELKGRVMNFVDSRENEISETIEVRQNAYRKEADRRFEKLEGVIAEVDTLDQSLRASQQKLLDDVKRDFQTFQLEMQERWSLDKDALDMDITHIRQEMNDLEHGLEEIKENAYENMSVKIRGVEDEFFTNLKDRGNQMQFALDEWEKDTELKINELGLKASNERDIVERRYSTELKQKYSQFQAQVLSQFDSVQDQIDGFKNTLSQRMHNSEEGIALFRQELSSQITVEKEAALVEFNKAFDGFGDATEGKFSKANKTISQKLSSFAQQIDENKKVLIGEFHSIQRKTSKWIEQLSSQMTEVERDSADRIESMKFDFATKMSELRDEYTGQTSQLISESNEERGLLRRDMEEIGETIDQLGNELIARSKETEDRLKDQSEALLMEFKKNSRESREEVERKVKELRQSVQDSRNRADAHRKEIMTHMDSEHNRLMQELAEIENRQNELIEGMRVFEKAEELKNSIETDIEGLDRRLETVSTVKDEMQGVNSQYERVMSLYEKAHEKIARFLEEQQKVDSLDAKIFRISSLSEAVDLKLDRMNDTNDSLQELQARLKKLESLHEDLGKQYDRLSNKAVVLDTTTDVVDKNFQQMMKIEEQVKELGEQIAPLREGIEKAEELQNRLLVNNEKIGSVINQVDSLETTIESLDARMEKMGKVREWLAQSETRLQKINEEIRHHLNLYDSLSTRIKQRKQGSPDMDTREIVVKLARQGWKTEEIARTAKLSLGEVELILELLPSEK